MFLVNLAFPDMMTTQGKFINFRKHQCRSAGHSLAVATPSYHTHLSIFLFFFNVGPHYCDLFYLLFFQQTLLFNIYMWYLHWNWHFYFLTKLKTDNWYPPLRSTFSLLQNGYDSLLFCEERELVNSLLICKFAKPKIETSQDWNHRPPCRQADAKTTWPWRPLSPLKYLLLFIS